MATIFEYQDYRNYLRDQITELKEEHKHLSQRAIQMKMGITSSGFLANVLAGRSNLTLPHVSKLAKILKLNKSETAYFETMILFNQAKGIDDKAEYFERMLSFQQTRLKVLTEKQLSLFSRWHYPIIRELANFIDVSDSKQLSQVLDPPISQSEAQESVEQLITLGVLKREKDGSIVQSDEIVTSGNEVRSFDIVKFQSATLNMARRALLRCPKELRDISVLTFTVSDECFEQVKEELRQVRKKILTLVQRDSAPDRVYQCSMNLFPVTKRKRNRA
jgi:uncharacterized protein (TIGR02147 family)